jgi:hypothetical protein
MVLVSNKAEQAFSVPLSGLNESIRIVQETNILILRPLLLISSSFNFHFKQFLGKYFRITTYNCVPCYPTTKRSEFSCLNEAGRRRALTVKLEQGSPFQQVLELQFLCH